MSVNWLFIKLLISVLLVLDCWVLGSTYYVKRASRRRYSSSMKLRALTGESLVSGNLDSAVEIPAARRLDYLYEWHVTAQTVELPEDILKQISELIRRWRVEPEIDKLLRSRSFKKRARGLNLIGFLGWEQRLELLNRTLQNESVTVLRLKIIQLLCEAEDPLVVDAIHSSIQSAEEYYKKKVLKMLSQNINLVLGWSDANRFNTDSDSRRIIILAARTRLRGWFSAFLIDTIKSGDRTAAEEAASVFMEFYADDHEDLKLFDAGPEDLRRKAVFHYFSTADLPGPEETAEMMKDPEMRNSVIAGLAERIRETPRTIPELFTRYQDAATEEERTGYAAVLSSKINYFMIQLRGEESGEIRELLDDAIALGISAPIINFLNVNKSLAVEKLLLETLRPHTETAGHFRHQCQLYLKADLREQLNLPPLAESRGKTKIQLTKADRFYMLLFAALTALVPLAVFFITAGSSLQYMSGEERLVSFLLMYHRIFAFYAVSISSIYLVLMILSRNVIRNQQISWSIADKKFLYTNGILPPVSILAPAYNEEKTIVQNIYSLLSLDYPNFELIVINDGSGDGTMKLLKEHFELKLIDNPLSEHIVTSPLVGLYRNSEIPNLLVIDKENGGKADALNAGLNAAKGEFVCSIDADSLLEPSALTKMMFQVLNNDRKTIAVGGNIIPVNGCRTKNGAIREIHLPLNRYSRYQTVEYMRSFITGRLGWTRLNSLMIISGAFGAFRRKEVVNIGGYMTGTGRMKKDTVGEDMELVVRLIRSQHEKGEKFHIDYAHNANCWTEVPEKLGDLLKQRDRWHRGLIEIFLFHKKMLFNKKYGAPGMIAFPFYLVFELLGPFWESYGYAVLILSLFLGLLNSQIFLFMFAIVVLLGILVSASALFLAEIDILYFQGKEFIKGILTVIEENFGYRQFISMHRAFSFLSYLVKNKGWQKLNRKGFEPESDEEAALDEI